MGAGRYVEVATYGAGEKVLGVVIRPGEVEVHIVADYPLPQEADSLAGLAERIREQVVPQAREKTVAIVVVVRDGTPERRRRAPTLLLRR